MIDSLVGFFSQFPPWLATILMAMTPVGELRLAIPVAVLGYHLPIWQVFILSVLGNFIPVAVILLFAGKFHKWVESKSGFFNRGWINALARAQKKFSGDYKKYGLVGLMIFIGIPLPMTGAYTGALAAFVFGISFKQSWIYVLGGLLISGIITILLTVGVGKMF